MGDASNVDGSVTVAKLSTLLIAAGLAIALWIIAIPTGLLGWVIAASVASAGTLFLAGFLAGFQWGVRRGEMNVTYPVTGTYHEGAKGGGAGAGGSGFIFNPPLNPAEGEDEPTQSDPG